jgi:hypothetical protein
LERRERETGFLILEFTLFLKEDQKSRVSQLIIDGRLRRMLFSAGFDSRSVMLSPKVGEGDSVRVPFP